MQRNQTQLEKSCARPTGPLSAQLSAQWIRNGLAVWVGVAAVLFGMGCQSSELSTVDPQLGEIVTRLAMGEASDDSALAADLNRLHALVLQTFAGQVKFVSKSDIVEIDPLGSYDAVDLLRWGVEMPPSDLNGDSAGAIVVRPVPASYAALVPLVVQGDWVDTFPLVYREYSRSFPNASVTDFLAGTLNQIDAVNQVVNIGDRGLVFQYESHSRLRRVNNLDTPGGTALLHWDHMQGEAVRVEGGNDGYLRFLFNFQIYLPISDDLAWRVGVNWTVAGGSFLFINGTANSGDVGKGIRRAFDSLELSLSQ